MSEVKKTDSLKNGLKASGAGFVSIERNKPTSSNPERFITNILHKLLEFGAAPSADSPVRAIKENLQAELAQLRK